MIAGGVASRFTKKPLWWASLRQLAFGIVAIAATTSSARWSVQSSRDTDAGRVIYRLLGIYRLFSGTTRHPPSFIYLGQVELPPGSASTRPRWAASPPSAMTPAAGSIT